MGPRQSKGGEQLDGATPRLKKRDKSAERKKEQAAKPGSKRKVPKALLKQKQQFLDTLKMEQIRSAKQTIKINQQRLKEEHKESDVLKSVSKNRLLKMVSGKVLHF